MIDFIRCNFLNLCGRDGDPNHISTTSLDFFLFATFLREGRAGRMVLFIASPYIATHILNRRDDIACLILGEICL